MPTRTLLTLAFAGTALAGCTTPTATPRYDGIGNSHVAVVAPVAHTLDLATAGGGLALGEEERAADWLASVGFGYGDRAALSADSAVPPGARDAVSRTVGRYGLLLSDVAPVTPGAVAPGTVRLVVLRAEASVPGCPAWSGVDVLFQGESRGFGCATATNLANMVADPNDLLTGKSSPDTGSSAATAVKAIEAQRVAAGTSAGGTVVRRESTQSVGSGGGN